MHLVLAFREVGDGGNLRVAIKGWGDFEEPLKCLAIETDGVHVSGGSKATLLGVLVQTEMKLGDHRGES